MLTPMPKEPTLQSVSLRHPAAYVFSCMANRFALEKEEGFTVAHFGLVSRKEALLDRFDCVFPDHMLTSQKDNLVQFSEKLGSSQKTIPTWDPPLRRDSEMTMPVVDFIHLSYGDLYAELCFWNYSQGTLGDIISAGQKAEISTWGVAMVRCDVDLQRAFLNELYPH